MSEWSVVDALEGSKEPETIGEPTAAISLFEINSEDHPPTPDRSNGCDLRPFIIALIGIVFILMTGPRFSITHPLLETSDGIRRPIDRLSGYYDPATTLGEYCGYVAPILAICMSFATAGPYYEAIKGRTELRCLPQKFTLMNLSNAIVQTWCGIWMADMAVAVTAVFNWGFMSILLLSRELCAVRDNLQTSITVWRRAGILSIATVVLWMSMGFLPNELREMVWMGTQSLPFIALALDFRDILAAHDRNGVSLQMTLCCLVNCACWLGYGISKDSIALIVPSVCGVIFPMLGFVVYFVLNSPPQGALIIRGTKIPFIEVAQIYAMFRLPPPAFD